MYFCRVEVENFCFYLQRPQSIFAVLKLRIFTSVLYTVVLFVISLGGILTWGSHVVLSHTQCFCFIRGKAYVREDIASYVGGISVQEQVGGGSQCNFPIFPIEQVEGDLSAIFPYFLQNRWGGISVQFSHISYFISDIISNLQKTAVHFTNFCENPIYHKKSEDRICKISHSQICINSENLI